MREHTARAGRSDRRRKAARERRARQAALADTAVAPDRPLVWKAGGRARTVAAAWYVCFAAVALYPVESDPGTVLSTALSCVGVAWMCCCLGLWRITADQDGIYVRRMWSTRFLPWWTVSRVDLHHDGVLEFVVRGHPFTAGLFAPAWWVRRTGGVQVGRTVADTLSVMAAHAPLRPTAATPAPARVGYVFAAVPMAAALMLTPLLRTL